jgi:hypothetical protein
LKLSTGLSADQVFSDYSERIVEFDKVVSWTQDEENTAKYKITQDIPSTKEDWIGLFKVMVDRCQTNVSNRIFRRTSAVWMITSLTST